MVGVHGRIVRDPRRSSCRDSACRIAPCTTPQDNAPSWRLRWLRAGRVRGPYCQRNGSRDWRRGFASQPCARACTTETPRSNSRADGTVTRAGRSWILWPEGQRPLARSTRLCGWLAALAAELAGGTAPCVTNEPLGNGGRLATAWALADYRRCRSSRWVRTRPWRPSRLPFMGICAPRTRRAYRRGLRAGRQPDPHRMRPTAGARPPTRLPSYRHPPMPGGGT